MPSSYTSSLRLTLPVQGELSGSWGNTVNTGITQLVDTSVAGTASITMTAANYTLSNNNGTTDEARAMFLVLGGTPGGSYQVICPAVSKLYFVTNNTGFAQTVKTSGGSGISVPTGTSMTLRCDGTNVVEALNASTSFTLSGALTVGGTTTLAANPTLSAGTANGVLYLNGSKVATSGTDLVFNATGLGIGTSSPSYKLTVSGSSPDIVAANTGANGTRIAITASNTAAYVSTTYSGSGIPLIFNTAGIGAAGSTQMTLDSSGNLGLGVTPSAWGAGSQALQNGGGSFFQYNNDRVFIGQNTYIDTSFGDRFIGNGYATRYRQYQGTHAFYVSTVSNSSGAGASQSLTQALTLDASGNLQVGTSSGTFINGKGIVIADATAARLKLADTDAGVGTSNGLELGFGGATGSIYNLENGAMLFGTNNTERARITSGGVLCVGYQGVAEGATPLQIDANSTGSTQYVARFANSSTSTSVYNVARWLQGAAGSAVGMIGTGGSAVANTGFQNTFVVGTQTSNALVFATADTERARITSGGDFGINGTPPTDSQFYSKNSAAGKFAGTFENHDAGGYGISIGTANTNLAFFYPNASRTGSPVGAITTNGSSTSYVTSSDRRLKENIAPAADAGPVIDAIEIVQHEWKVGGHTRFGVIAQDLNAVAPEAVLQGDDGDEIEKTWGVDYSKLVPMLIKEIQSLRQRVQALEAQP